MHDEVLRVSTFDTTAETSSPTAFEATVMSLNPLGGESGAGEAERLRAVAAHRNGIVSVSLPLHGLDRLFAFSAGRVLLAEILMRLTERTVGAAGRMRTLVTITRDEADSLPRTKGRTWIAEELVAPRTFGRSLRRILQETAAGRASAGGTGGGGNFARRSSGVVPALAPLFGGLPRLLSHRSVFGCADEYRSNTAVSFLPGPTCIFTECVQNEIFKIEKNQSVVRRYQAQFAMGK